VQLLVTVGPLAAEMRAGFAAEGHSVADSAAAVELLAGTLRAGDVVLVKGSRGVGLEHVAQALGARQARACGHDGAESVLAPGGRPGRR
jgi:UDP-N-acetylmuramoyl-tripeptide--D-alanyl-D-alanine ligase